MIIKSCSPLISVEGQSREIWNFNCGEVSKKKENTSDPRKHILHPPQEYSLSNFAWVHIYIIYFLVSAP